MSDFVPVYKSSFVVEEQNNLIKITTEIPKREKMSVYLGLAFFVLFALGYACVTPLTLITHHNRAEGVASFLYLFFWAVPLLGLASYIVFIGVKRTLKHIIEVTDNSVTILEGDYKYYLRPKKYEIKFVKNLRGSTYPNRKEGAVKFDYGSQTIVFGKSLEEAEANLIVQAIIKKYPSLKE